jgi:hypothetical protein
MLDGVAIIRASKHLRYTTVAILPRRAAWKSQCRAVAYGTQATKRVKYEPLPPDWQAVIGVEVHAQLKSKKKLFSTAWTEDSATSYEEAENSLVAPFDAALPGTLPSLQVEPLSLALRACLALECLIAKTTAFDRKHYFYPDLTSGYQITQKYGESPLVKIAEGYKK